MTRYYGAAVTGIDEVDGLDTWVWAGHDGLHCSPTRPAGHIPTGHVWAWGGGVWLHWRDDPTGQRGLLVRSRPFDGAEELVVTSWSANAESGGYPRVVAKRPQQLLPASEADRTRLGQGGLQILSVIHPIHALLVGAP